MCSESDRRKDRECVRVNGRVIIESVGGKQVIASFEGVVHRRRRGRLASGRIVCEGRRPFPGGAHLDVSGIGGSDACSNSHSGRGLNRAHRRRIGSLLRIDRLVAINMELLQRIDEVLLVLGPRASVLLILIRSSTLFLSILILVRLIFKVELLHRMPPYHRSKQSAHRLSAPCSGRQVG